MSEAQADTIVILSSELIAKITQEYFNKTMFKQKVEIVDLKPHGESGYAFSVAFVSQAPSAQSNQVKPVEETVAPYVYKEDREFLQTFESPNGAKRDSKGKFVKTQ
jgi:hypothetical protein